MDTLSHRLANALLGNAEEDATMEVSIEGPTLKLLCDTHIAVCGANFAVAIDGQNVPTFAPILIRKGQVLSIGKILSLDDGRARGHHHHSHPDDTFGVRGYLAVSGGFQVPKYLCSRSTFPMGGFGGHQVSYTEPSSQPYQLMQVAHFDNQLDFAGPDSYWPTVPTGCLLRRIYKCRYITPPLRGSVGDRRYLWTPRRSRLLHRRRHANILRNQLAGAL
jgi:hypothetical protein